MTALEPLATTADLTARNISVPSGMDANTILAAASDAVRDAAGCPISQTTSTVDLVLMDDWTWLDLPGGPVTSVASLSIDGTDIARSTLTSGVWSTGWRKVGDSLLLDVCDLTLPATATVTYTHGYAAIPGDIVDLVCGLAAMAFRQDGDYGAAGREQSVRLGDYAESERVPSGSDSPSPLAIPDGVRNRLRTRFGTAVVVVGVRH